VDGPGAETEALLTAQSNGWRAECEVLLLLLLGRHSNREQDD
jgi:hypothetical protein